MIPFQPVIKRYPTLRGGPDPGVVVEVEPRKRHERPYFMTGNQPDPVLTIAANGSGQVLMQNNVDGPIEITRLAMQSTDVFLANMQIEDGTTIRALMNNPIHSSTIFGNGQQPYILPEALYIHEGHNLTFRATDLSGAQNAMRLNFLGAQYTKVIYDPKMLEIRKRFRSKEKRSMPYWYTTDQGVVTLAGNANGQFPIEISDDAHFLLQQISGTSTGTYSLDIFDSVQGESIFDAPSNTSYRLPNQLVVGTANFPFKFEQGILMEAGTKLILDILDTSGVSNDIYVTLGGVWLTKYMWR